jgi:hypothetical protein
MWPEMIVVGRIGLDFENKTYKTYKTVLKMKFYLNTRN